METVFEEKYPSTSVTTAKHGKLELEQTYHGGLLIRVSEWLLINVNSAIFQLDHCESKLIFYEMMMNTACLAEKQQIPILSYVVWPYRGSNPLLTALEVSTLTITPPILVLQMTNDVLLNFFCVV
jgi:hypothetical protein